MKSHKKTLAPSLRFPQFTGEWKEKKLHSLLQRIRDSVVPEPDQLYREIGVRSHGRGIFHKEVVTGASLGSKRIFKVIPHALILNIVFAWEQAVAITTADEAGFVASHRFPMFLEKEGESSLEFILAFLLTDRGKNLLEIASPGGAGRNKTLGQEEFLELQVCVPSQGEQKKIATFLTALDQTITALNRKLELLQQYKRGIIQKIVSGDISFKRDDGDNYPEWKETTLSEILNYEQPTKYLVETTDYRDEYDIPVLTAGKTFILGYTNEKQGVYKEPLPAIIFDDFTTSMQFVDFPFKAKSSAMKILTPKENENSLRVIYEFMSLINFPIGEHKRYWISEYQQSTIFLPHPDEQKKIAEFLYAMDERLRALSKQIDLIRVFKQGLTQQMFV
ncbi:restriction endonuclease subunit S [Brucella anthropi]